MENENYKSNYGCDEYDLEETVSNIFGRISIEEVEYENDLPF
jgi:hypothetical protein